MADDKQDQAIAKHRMGTLIVKTTPGAKVRVQQLKHEFWFGTAIARRAFGDRGNARDWAKYLQILKDNFNAAVHENALKWYSTEREQGKISYRNAQTMLRWCDDNGIAMRGHCVFWCVDKFVQPWIKELDDAALRAALRRRATDLLSTFKGRISEYDVNNEMIHGNYYAKRLGDDIRHKMFGWCKEADPGAVLYVNDYGVLSGRDLPKYERHIESLLKAGVPVGGIGLQGHFGGKVDAAKVQRVLDRLARFNLPIKVTEFDINTEDEQAKAKGLVDLYTTCFAHRCVNGILMWGFWEGAHWRPKAALWKKDWTETPAAKAYRDLLFKQWWTDFAGNADEQGICKVKVFYGRHEVRAAGARPKVVEVSKTDGTKTVELPAQQGAAVDPQ